MKFTIKRREWTETYVVSGLTFAQLQCIALALEARDSTIARVLQKQFDDAVLKAADCTIDTE